jgi:hypothetical protein
MSHVSAKSGRRVRVVNKSVINSNLFRSEQKKPRGERGAFALNIVKRMKRSVLGRPGSDLLFQTLRFSTIGAEDFDGRVRDGIG